MVAWEDPELNSPHRPTNYITYGLISSENKIHSTPTTNNERAKSKQMGVAETQFSLKTPSQVWQPTRGRHLKNAELSPGQRGACASHQAL